MTVSYLLTRTFFRQAGLILKRLTSKPSYDNRSYQIELLTHMVERLRYFHIRAGDSELFAID
jgi:hypothetical protein